MAGVVRAGSLGCLVVLLVGCGVTADNTACTLIGADSGVVFEFPEVLAAHPGEPLLVEACVQSECESLKVGRSNRQHGLAVGQHSITDGSPVVVSLTVTNGGASRLTKGI
jgi:hypothetical protein